MVISEIGPDRAERRQYPRVDRKIRVDMHFDSHGYDIRGETHDISPVGTYCQVDRPIPEMTQLKIILDLPTDQVKCEGTVVRSVSGANHSDLHHLAIFFHEISDEAKHKLAEFLSLSA